MRDTAFSERPTRGNGGAQRPTAQTRLFLTLSWWSKVVYLGESGQELGLIGFAAALERRSLDGRVNFNGRARMHAFDGAPVIDAEASLRPRASRVRFRTYRSMLA